MAAKTAKPATDPAPLPPPPAMVLQKSDGPCAVDSLNVILNSLIRMRDVLAAFEQLSKVDANSKSIENELRERVQTQVRLEAKAFETWTAYE